MAMPRTAMASAAPLFLAIALLACASASTPLSAPASATASAPASASTFAPAFATASLFCSASASASHWTFSSTDSGYAVPGTPRFCNATRISTDVQGSKAKSMDVQGPNAKSMGLVTRLYATPASSLLADAPAPYLCRPVPFANLIVLVCSGSTATQPAKECCSTILEVDRPGGLQCLCDTASGSEISNSGYTVGDVLGWYAGCGGRLQVDHSDLASTCSGQVAVEQQDDFKDGSPPPPPPPATPLIPTQASEASVSRPTVLVIPHQEHPAEWPWWGIVLAIVITMLFILAVTYMCCIVGCGRLLSWLSEWAMWLYGIGRRAAADGNQRGPTYCNTTSRTGQDLVPETQVSDLPPTGVTEVRDLAPLTPPPTRTVMGYPL